VVSADTIVWITGASSGIGAGLAATCPYEGARIINISRRANPNAENVLADLSEPDAWDAIITHLESELAAFRGRRAIFVHNAFLLEPVGFIGEIDPAAYRRHILANAAASLILAEAFLRLVPTGIEAGLVLMSSAAARVPFAGMAGYCASKAAMEQWARAVRSEHEHRRSTSWVVAIRPGGVDTPSMRAEAAYDSSVIPVAPEIRAALEAGLLDSVEVASRRIWDQLPPPPGSSPVILLGEMIAPPRPDPLPVEATPPAAPEGRAV